MSVQSSPTTRSLARVITAVETLEGGGFQVRRPIPVRGVEQVDPFLLIDEMGPMEHGPGEAAGAPDHPHKGFELITYLLAGEMEHLDSHGNHGVLRAGDVQYMAAGSGLVHSEMPTEAFQRRGGKRHGFQIWVNLKRADKPMVPRYRDVRPPRSRSCSRRGRDRAGGRRATRSARRARSTPSRRGSTCTPRWRPARARRCRWHAS